MQYYLAIKKRIKFANCSSMNGLVGHYWVRSLGREDPLEKEIATLSSILAWRIPWMEELGGLQFTGRKSWTRLSDFTFTLTTNNDHMAAPRPFSVFLTLSSTVSISQGKTQGLCFSLEWKPGRKDTGTSVAKKQ